MPKVTTALHGALAFIPNQATAPVRETMQFLTDVISSHNGIEQSIPLRNSPRRGISYNIPVQAIEDPSLFNTIYGGIRVKWGIPMWTEGQFLGTVAGGLTTLPCDTVYHDLRPNSLALLWSSNTSWKVIEISSITNSSISFVTVIPLLTNAYLLPMRVGYIDGSVIRPSNGYGSTFQINFDIDDLLTTLPAAPAQFLSNDIYYDPPIKNSGGISTSFQKEYDTIDFELGLVARRTAWVNTRYGSKYRAICDGPVESKTYLDFLKRRVGKYRRFWMPTFENNMRLKNTGTIVSTLQVHRDSYDDYAVQRVHVVFESAGVWYPRVLSAPSYPDGTTAQFTLDTPLNIAAAAINRISYLGLYRLDSDTAELDWLGNNVLDGSINVLELVP